MAPDRGRPYVDALSMSAEDVLVYEAVATLEGAGRAVTRSRIAAIAGLDSRVLDRALDRLTDRQALVRTQAGDEPGYELAHRDWRAASDGR
jgi:DNA-binding IscR family transcriptional regulator